MVTAETPLHGAGPSLHLTYGITDAFNFVSELQGTFYPARSVTIGNASAGIAYVFDVLRWVPYVGLMGGAYVLASTESACKMDCVALRPGGSLPFGLDYQISRSLAVGFAGRDQLIFGGGGVTHTLTLGARVEYIWGY